MTNFINAFLKMPKNQSLIEKAQTDSERAFITNTLTHHALVQYKKFLLDSRKKINDELSKLN